MQLFGGKGKMLGLLLVLAAFGSFYLGDITAFTTSQKAIAGVALFIIVLLAGISLLKPKKTEEDMIAEQDERNQYCHDIFLIGIVSHSLIKCWISCLILWVADNIIKPVISIRVCGW